MMKFNQTVLRILVGIVMISLLAGCATTTPTAAPTAAPNNPPTQAPTANQAATLSVLGTQVAQTYIANQTLNAPAATAVPPTATPAPATNTPPPATATPTVASTPLPPTATYVWPTITPQFSPTPKAYDCIVLDVSPKQTDKIKAESDFTGSWVVVNTGTGTWPQPQTDIKYVSGEKFQLNGDIVDLNNGVSSNQYYNVYVNMKAPKYSGPYFATWAIVYGDQTVCSLNIAITVVQ
jgi:hypothetical protein